MYEWIFAVQQLVDWIEDNIADKPSLADISAHIGYSPCYCSEQFRKISGMSIREYVALRRLCKAALEIRDTERPIVDIAMDFGFSSQQALTRAFRNAYGCAPYAYRKNPVPIPLSMRKVVVDPSHCIKKQGESMMSVKKVVSIRVEYIPEHRYLGVYREAQTSKGKIWPGHDCDLLCGIVSSIKEGDAVVAPHTAGWKWVDGKREYFYGSGVSTDYSGDIPEGFELSNVIPGSYYIVFSYPPFDYLTENAKAMGAVEDIAWSYDPATLGFEWNEEACPDYQRHYSEVFGYHVLRPVKKLKK